MMSRIFGVLLSSLAITVIFSSVEGKAITESCNATAEVSECPAHASCLYRSCDGQVCVCDEGYGPSGDGVLCLELAELDRPCDDETVVCRGVYTVCTSLTCSCRQGYIANEMNTQCKREASFGNSYALLGEFCDEESATRTVCMESFEQSCVDSACTCNDGSRPATQVELDAYPFQTLECRPNGFNESLFIDPESCPPVVAPPTPSKIGELCLHDNNCPNNAECVTECSEQKCICILGYVPNVDNDSCLKVVGINATCDDASTVCSDGASSCTGGVCKCSTSYAIDVGAFPDVTDFACKLSIPFGPSFGGLEVSCDGVLNLCSPNLQCLNNGTGEKLCQCSDGTEYISSDFRRRNPRLLGLCQQDMITFTQATTCPTTQKPAVAEPTTQEPTTDEPTTQEPTTDEPTTQEPTTVEPTTQEPTTVEPTTQEPTTVEPTTQEPTTDEPTTQEPTTVEPTTQEQTTDEPTTQEPTTDEPTTQEPVQYTEINERCGDEHPECPPHATCRVFHCTGHVCRCESGWIHSEDQTECLIAVGLGDACNSTTRCAGNKMECSTFFGVCRCLSGYDNTSDNSRCKPSIGVAIGLLGEECADAGEGPFCFNAHEQACNTTSGTCQCNTPGSVAFTPSEIELDPFNILECKPNGFNYDVIDPTCILEVAFGESCSDELTNCSTAFICDNATKLCACVEDQTVNSDNSSCIEVAVVKIGADCAVEGATCPENSACEQDACDYRRCRCDVNTFPVNDDQECGEGRNLTDPCGSTSKCIVPGSVCNTDGVCECSGLNRPSGDGLACVPPSNPFITFSAYGESCASGEICFLSFELQCLDGTCQCKTDYQPKTNEERLDTYTSPLRCVPDGYLFSRSAFACPRTAEEPEEPASVQSPLPLAFGLTMTVLVVAVIATITVTRWRRIRKRRADAENDSLNPSSDGDSVVGHGMSLFRGDKSWSETRRPYVNPVANL